MYIHVYGHTDFRNFDQKNVIGIIKNLRKSSFCELKIFFIFRSRSPSIWRHMALFNDSYSEQYI